MPKELWRECVDWLINTGVLPQQHKTTLRGAQVFSLAQTLRDGVVLSNVLNVIRPGSVDMAHINVRPQMLKFSCIQNLRTVLKSLQQSFGIPQQDLFFPSDLYDMINFRKVLKVLSTLSYLPISSSKFRPFPPGSSQPQRNSVHRSEEEEDVYRKLQDLANEHELVDEEEDLYDCVPDETKEEGIYGDLIAFKGTSVSQTRDKRSYCVEEIAETERNYVQHLEMLQWTFMEPLKKILKPEDIQIIFINLNQLIPVHAGLLKSIQHEKKNNAEKMSRCFLSNKDNLLMYGTYCSKLNDAVEHLKELIRDHDSIRMSVEDCQKNAIPSRFKLHELLCIPMQRILKYQLLLKELNKCTNDQHSDKADLGKALEAVQEISQYLNEVKRDCEMLATINQVERCLVDYRTHIPLHTYGRLLKDGELKIKNSNDRNAKARFTMLFDQALFMTSEKNGTYKMKDLVRLEDFKLDESAAHIKGHKWTWTLTSTKYGINSLILSAKSSMDKTKWLESIKTAYDNINPVLLRGKEHNFKMHNFKEPTYCDNCKKLLLGCFFQGYMCERTNMKCHKRCLADTWRKIENNETPPMTSSRSHRQQPLIPTQPSSMGLTCRAHRDYNGVPPPPFASAQHITFEKGDLVEVDDKVSLEWWKGHTLMQLDRQGYFPASFVSPLGPPQLPTSSPRPRVQRRSVDGSGNLYDVALPMLSSPSQLEQYYWYAGVMERGEAEHYLTGKPSGTFLVRSSHAQLAISLIYQQEKKHIRINQSSDNTYYVADCKHFRSVQELVKYYQETSMASSFLGLETTLKIPYRHPEFFPNTPSLHTFVSRTSHNHPIDHRVSQPTMSHAPLVHSLGKQQSLPAMMEHLRLNGTRTISIGGKSYDIIGRARVLFNFEARSTQELGLQERQIVNILSKAGDEQGWWKGECDGRIGYFPSSFIEEV